MPRRKRSKRSLSIRRLVALRDFCSDTCASLCTDFQVGLYPHQLDSQQPTDSMEAAQPPGPFACSYLMVSPVTPPLQQESSEASKPSGKKRSAAAVSRDNCEDEAKESPATNHGAKDISNDPQAVPPRLPEQQQQQRTQQHMPPSPRDQLPQPAQQQMHSLPQPPPSQEQPSLRLQTPAPSVLVSRLTELAACPLAESVGCDFLTADAHSLASHCR